MSAGMGAQASPALTTLPHGAPAPAPPTSALQTEALSTLPHGAPAPAPPPSIPPAGPASPAGNQFVVVPFWPGREVTLTRQEARLLAAALAAVALAGSWAWRRRVMSRLREIRSAAQLVWLTADGFGGATARAALAGAVQVVRVEDQGPLAAFPARVGSLHNLQTLDLSGNSLLQVPRSIGALRRLTRLNLARNQLTELPPEIGAVTSLTDVDASANRMIHIPPEIGQLHRLKYLNLMSNELVYLPEEVGALTALARLGLKANKLKALPDSFGGLTALVELFLTDNELAVLPASFGQLSSLVKLQLSFNCLEALPVSIGNLSSLELLRLAVNDIAELPPSLSRLDRLAWLSLASNPACPPAPPPRARLQTLLLDELNVGQQLGDGASGDVFAAEHHGRDVALKIFKAENSPDGHAADEIAVACFVDHPNLVTVRAVIEEPHALVLDKVNAMPLAKKPNLASLLRCRWEANLRLTPAFVHRVALCLTDALWWLHRHGVAHGDVYAHNVLADEDGTAVLCDYGAAFFYTPGGEVAYEAHEVRAFGLLLADLVDRIDTAVALGAAGAAEKLRSLADDCCGGTAAASPAAGCRTRFSSVYNRLGAMKGEAFKKQR